MNESILPYGQIDKISFTRRPTSLPADIRPFRRIGQILLVLYMSSSKGKSPILKIQFFNTLFAANQNVERFCEAYELDDAIRKIQIRLDPFVNRAISLAIGKGYIKSNGKDGHIELLEKGRKLAQKIAEDEEIFELEKQVLSFTKKGISTAKLNRILKKA